MGDKGVTCSVRLAKYDNLADHRPLVWVVHLDGLAIEALAGVVVTNGTRRPPRFLRRALVVVPDRSAADGPLESRDRRPLTSGHDLLDCRSAT